MSSPSIVLNRRSFLGLTGLLLLATIFALTQFAPLSLRLDESQSLWQVSHSAEGLLYIVAQDVHVPLYHLLLHAWQSLSGGGLLAARLLSLFFFLGSILAMYGLGTYLFGQKQGFFAAALLALSPFTNWYGSEARMYTLFVFAILLNYYFFLRLYREGADNHLWLGFVLSGLVSIYSHYFFLFSLLAQGIFLLTQKRHSLRSWLAASTVIILAITPWFIYMSQLGLASNSRPVIPAPNSVSFFNTFSNFLFGFQTDQLNSLLLSAWPLLVLLAFWGLAARCGERRPEIAFLAYALLLPLGLVFLISVLVQPIYLSRYLIFTLPPFYLLIVWLFGTYPPSFARFARGTLIAIMVAMLFVQIQNPRAPVKEDYRAASEYLASEASARDLIVVSAPFTIYPIEYYYRGPATLETLPRWNRRERGAIPTFSTEQLASDGAALTQNAERLWLLLSYDQGYEEEVRLFFDQRWQRVDRRDFSPGLTLYAYQIRYPSG